MKFSEIIKVNGKEISKHYIESLTYEQREELIEPIFVELRKIGFLYPDDLDQVNKDWNKLKQYNPDTSVDEIYGNSSMATSICRYFCHEFYNATERGKRTMPELFEDDQLLRKLIKNRLGMDWLKDSTNKKGEVLAGVNEAFSISFKMIIQGMRSTRNINQTSIFKPEISKLITMKYSNSGETVFDPSCGFGARLLGCMSSDRKYVGTDPMTVGSLEKMAEYFKFDKNNYRLIDSGSEDYRGEENSIDFSYTSPPYNEQEYYGDDDRQAYNKGEDYYYNVYLRKTLENVKYMLKPDRVFGLNIINYPKVVEIAKEYFGEPFEIFKLRLVRSHLTKKSSTSDGREAVKYEPVYMFKNKK